MYRVTLHGSDSCRSLSLLADLAMGSPMIRQLLGPLDKLLVVFDLGPESTFACGARQCGRRTHAEHDSPPGAGADQANTDICPS